MRTRQRRPKTAVDQCLSILLRNTRDFELQLFELNTLRRVMNRLSGAERAAGYLGEQRKTFARGEDFAFWHL
jgi:hypothetical protein